MKSCSSFVSIWSVESYQSSEISPPNLKLGWILKFNFWINASLFLLERMCILIIPNDIWIELNACGRRWTTVMRNDWKENGNYLMQLSEVCRRFEDSDGALWCYDGLQSCCLIFKEMKIEGSLVWLGSYFVLSVFKVSVKRRKWFVILVKQRGICVCVVWWMNTKTSERCKSWSWAMLQIKGWTLTSVTSGK